MPTVIIVLIVIVAIGTAIGVAGTSGGPTKYACMQISNLGGNVKITTSGLIHYLKAQYYITCNEGSPLPTGQLKSACVTISPQTIPAQIGIGASTEYYYISGGSGGISLQGAPAPTNGTEIIQPTTAYLQTSC